MSFKSYLKEELNSAENRLVEYAGFSDSKGKTKEELLREVLSHKTQYEDEMDLSLNYDLGCYETLKKILKRWEEIYVQRPTSSIH